MEKKTEVCCSRCKQWISNYYTYGIFTFCEACDDPEHKALLKQDAPECVYEEAL